MKKKFYYLLALTSLFSLFSCSSNEPSNITSLQIGYNGSTSILEGSVVSLDQIVNGTIDNENKFEKHSPKRIRRPYAFLLPICRAKVRQACACFVLRVIIM